MRFQVLGALECWHDGVRVPIGGPRQRAVLATLLLHANQLVGTELLTDAVWATAPASPRSNLRTYVSGLRRGFHDAGADPSIVESRHGSGYRLRISATDVDAHVFDDLADTGQHALERGDFAGAESLFSQSLGLWHGVPLDGEAVGATLLALFTRLQQRRLSAVEAYARAAIHNGRADRVLADLRAEVVRHPLRETLWVQLITALDVSGHRGEALRGYADIRRILAEELGVEPGPDLRALHRRMLGAVTTPRVPTQPARARQAWTVPEIPFKLDRQVIILPANLQLVTAGTLIVRDRQAVESLIARHRPLRAAVQPLPAGGNEPPGYLVAVLHQLVRGATDAVAAAELGISPRSYSRRISDLVALLGVATRFQAGVEAARRGWT